MGGKICIVSSCKSNSTKNKIGFFKLPEKLKSTDKYKISKKNQLLSIKRRDAWLKFIKLQDTVKTSYVCGLHFVLGIITFQRNIIYLHFTYIIY